MYEGKGVQYITESRLMDRVCKGEEVNLSHEVPSGVSIVGAPDDYISTGELMQRIYPEAYKVYSSMQDEAYYGRIAQADKYSGSAAEEYEAAVRYEKNNKIINMDSQKAFIGIGSW